MRFLLASLTVATASLFAQANDPATKKVDVKFRALSFDAPIIGSGFLDGRDAKRLDISNDFLSGEQTYRGLATIAFVMVDDLAKQAPEVPVEIVAANGRRTAAQERARKASEEYTRLSALIAKATTRSAELSDYEVELLTAELQTMAESSRFARDWAEACRSTI